MKYLQSILESGLVIERNPKYGYWSIQYFSNEIWLEVQMERKEFKDRIRLVEKEVLIW